MIAAAAVRTPEAIEASKLLYLGAGFALTWAAITAYLFSVARRQRRLEQRIAKLQAQAKPDAEKLDSEAKSS